MKQPSLVVALLVAMSAFAPLHAQSGISVEGKKVLVGDVACPAGQSLIGFSTDGSEHCICGPGLTQCTSSCTDLASDSQNCGACENDCPVGVPCREGRCRECEVFSQDCSDPGAACYFFPPGGFSACAVPIFNGTGQQGEACTFANECAPSFGCVLPDDVSNPAGFECALFCDPMMTYPSDADTFCASQVGAGFRCVRITDLYSDIEDAEDVAFCVGPEWFP